MRAAFRTQLLIALYAFHSEIVSLRDVNELKMATDSGSDSQQKLLKKVPASPGEAPFFAAILREGPSNKTRIIGGGTVIGKNVILTAAHLFHKKDYDENDEPVWIHIPAEEYRVAVGCQSREEIESGRCEQRKCRVIYTHKDFTIEDDSHPIYGGPPSKEDTTFDIALIFVEDLCLTANVAPIGVAGTDQQLPPKGTVYGLGSISADRNPVYPNELQKIDLKLEEMGTCDSTRKFICNVPEEYFDACRGDSGGGLIVELSGDEPVRALLGVVASGPNPCGREGRKSKFTNVPAFKAWIEAAISTYGKRRKSFSELVEKDKSVYWEQFEQQPADI